MNNSELAIIVLAAGNSKRMLSSLPKWKHKIGNFQLIEHVFYKTKQLNAKQVVTVISPKMQQYENELLRFGDVSYQTEQLGTANAVFSAKNKISIENGVILILYCDTPLLSVDVLNELIKSITINKNDVAVIGFNETKPNSYGRLITNNNQLLQIIEAKDLLEEHKNITLCNSGVMAISANKIWDLLSEISNKNNSNEYYLTDIVKIAVNKGLNCGYVIDDAKNAMGVNSKLELSLLEEIFQDNKRKEFLNAGVTLIDPKSVFFSLDTKIGNDVVIHPFCIFKENVTIENNVTIEAFSTIEGAEIKSNTIIGPYARIRPGSVIDEDAKIGNFVEIKKSYINKKAKINHLSYIGDAKIGANTNIGAGVITCNYNGSEKSTTVVGENSFVGSNSSLIAPVTIGNNTLVAAGSTITSNVEDNSLAIARAKQVNKDSWVIKNKKDVC